MPQRTLRFRIRQDGLVEETVEGVVGKDCELLTKLLEEDLGVVHKRELKAEAYESSQSQIQPIPLEIN